MEPKTYDAIIIGTGQAGPGLANRFTEAGQCVAIIERSLFGGTCVNTGCIPTKAMVASAYAAFMARRAADFGVQTGGPVTVDMQQVKARKDGISGKSNSAVEKSLRRMEGCTVYQGHARFESAHTVHVGDNLLTAPRVFINAGARATRPPIPGLEETGYLTNSGMMSVDFLPPHLLILGGSYIGLEFAQMFRRFGSQVTILQGAPRLIEREDPDISQSIQQFLEAEDIRVVLGAHVISAARREGNVVLRSNSAEYRGSHVLAAVGRRPNTDDLGLDRAGIATDAKGYIIVDDQLRTNVEGVWAVGDCNGRGGFTHTSYNDHEIVAGNLLDGRTRRVSDRIPTYALFTDPPLGRAGMTETEARATGKKLLIGQRPMTKVGRAFEKSETNGFMKVIIEGETNLILGAAILGTGGDEVIHLILDVMYARKPYTLIRDAVHVHPTVSELVPTLLGELKPAVLTSTV
jgi:pyruvate/2-oxoglutarate dehydrogenase complex dihydrolipoamide dehydrogenase (E3) component